MRCLLLHPHPDHGGDQHNAVIRALFAELDGAERFDFASSDPEAAAGQVREHLQAGDAWLIGYSFGGCIAALVDDPAVRGWVLIAPALAMAPGVIGPDPRPKHVLAGERDQFFAPAALEEATAHWAATTHDTVPGADHFFRGQERDVAARCAAWLADRKTFQRANHG